MRKWSKAVQPYIKPLGWLAGAVILSRSYIEPGFMSFFLKVLISTLVGAAVAYRYVLDKIKPLFRRRNEEEEEEE